MPNLDKDILIQLLRTFTSFVSERALSEPDFRDLLAFANKPQIIGFYRDLLNSSRYYEASLYIPAIRLAPCYNQLVNLLDTDSRLAAIRKAYASTIGDYLVSDDDLPQLRTDTIATTFFVDYLYNSLPFDFDERLATEIANNFLWCLDSGNTKVAYQAVLTYLNTFFVYLQLGNPEVSLRPGLDTIMPKLNTGITDYTLGISHYRPPFSVIEITSEVPLHTDMDMFKPSTSLLNEIKDYVYALRLLKVDKFFWESTLVIKAGPGYLVGPRTLITGTEIAMPFLRSQYLLDIHEHLQYPDYVTLVKKMQTDARFTLALERYYSSVTRISDYDAIIDLCIALEAIYTDDNTDNIAYKLSMRCAAYLGDSDIKRMKIAKHVSKAYSIRSKIVHGTIKGLYSNHKAHSMVKWARICLQIIVRGSLLCELKQPSKVMPTTIDFDKMLLSTEMPDGS